jgi:hypothetical protein
MEDTELVARIAEKVKSGSLDDASKLANELKDVQERESWYEIIADEMVERQEIREILKQFSLSGEEEDVMPILTRRCTVRIRVRHVPGKNE